MALHLLSHAEQVAAHLRGELLRGRWRNVLPGIQNLGKELGVNHNTVEAALRLLEDEGLLAAQGHGRPRKVSAPKEGAGPRSLRVKILLYEGADRVLPDHVDLLLRLQAAGFAADFAVKSQDDLGMQVEKVARFVEKNPADAWVLSSASREILKWFASQPVPVIAMYGSFTGIPIAGACPRKTPAMLTAVRKLVSLGHRRIVMLTREERRKPPPGLFEQNFLNELAAHGLMTGPYNLPNWDETPAGLHVCLDSLFRNTPPSALISTDTSIFLATQQYLAQRGLRVPEHVSVLSSDPDPAFVWCNPPISHIGWDFRPIVKRVVDWVEDVAHGRENKEQKFFDATFVEGGTIVPAAQARS